MAADIFSSNERWFDLFQKWDEHRNNTPRKLELALENVKSQCASINGLGGAISTLTGPPINSDEIYTFWEHGNKLWNFTNSIHYEWAELVDLPFASSVGKVLNDAYALNPNDVTITRNFNTGALSSVTLTLGDLLKTSLQDAPLKDSLQALMYALDHDTISHTAQNILQEADFWQGEFEKAAEIRELTDQVFTPEMRAAWPNMTQAERDAIVQEFVKLLGSVLGGENPPVTEARWGNGTFAPYNGTYINLSDGFIQYRDGVASNVERLIDSIVHESYHKYQYEVRANPEAYGAPQELADEWNEPYLNTGDPHPTISGYKVTYENYGYQPLEYDTRAFASLCMQGE